jgi:hypothetical protein
LAGDQDSTVQGDVYKLAGAELLPVTCPARSMGSDVSVQGDSNLAQGRESTVECGAC